MQKDLRHYGENNQLNNFKLLLFLISFATILNLSAQESLHLVGTISGTGEHDKLIHMRAIGDINRDGYDDFITSVYMGDTLVFIDYYPIYCTRLYYGSATFDTIPDLVFPNSICYPLGDINNDGYDELMAIETDYMGLPREKLKIYSGSQDGIDTTLRFTFIPEFKWDREFSYTIDKIGDLNGDGYRDFVISSPYNWNNDMGEVYVFHGGAEIKNETVQILSYKIKEEGITFFGKTVVGIGDQNKDGYDDILISVPPWDSDSGSVLLYYGGERLDSIPNKIIMHNEPFFGRVLKSAGDLNGDGNQDFIISADNYYIYFNTENYQVMDFQKFGMGGFISTGTGGDINNDGYDDFLAGNTNVLDSNKVMTGAVFGFWGENEIDTLPAYRIIGHKKWLQFGSDVEIAGDINNDGFDDILIMELEYPDYTTPYGKIYIYSFKSLSDVSTSKPEIESAYSSIDQNYPNPFNSETKISYKIKQPSEVTLKLYNSLGSEVCTLLHEYKTTGDYEYKLNTNGLSLASGVYLVEMTATGEHIQSAFHKTIKILLMK